MSQRALEFLVGESETFRLRARREHALAAEERFAGHVTKQQAERKGGPLQQLLNLLGTS